MQSSSLDPAPHYIVASLKRRPGTKWGLSVSSTTSSSSSNHPVGLMVSATDPVQIQGWIQGWYAVAHDPRVDDAVLQQLQLQQPQVPLLDWIKILVCRPSVSTMTTILPGDCIWAVNCRSVASYTSFSEITQVLSTSQTASLLLVRHSPPPSRPIMTTTTTTSLLHRQHPTLRACLDHPYPRLVTPPGSSTSSSYHSIPLTTQPSPPLATPSSLSKRTLVFHGATITSNTPTTQPLSPVVKKTIAGPQIAGPATTTTTTPVERPSCRNVLVVGVEFPIHNPLFVHPQGKYIWYADDQPMIEAPKKTGGGLEECSDGAQLNPLELNEWHGTWNKEPPPYSPTGHSNSNTTCTTNASESVIVPPRAALSVPSFHSSSYYSVLLDPDEGTRAKLFLRPIPDIASWLARRKAEWRQRYQVHLLEDDTNLEWNKEPRTVVHDFWRTHPCGYATFSQWLSQRKQEWRQTYTVHSLWDSVHDSTAQPSQEPRTVAVDFWTRQGYTSLDHWLSESTLRWKALYSWNQRKRKRMEQDCDEVVHVQHNEFGEWLRVRKNQWRIWRRKRQRERYEQEQQQKQQQQIEQNCESSVTVPSTDIPREECRCNGIPPAVGTELPQKVQPPRPGTMDDVVVIDALLEERERQEQAAQARRRPPLDLALLLDPSRGVPDDVVVHFLECLSVRDQSALLGLNRELRHFLTEARDSIWRSLFPSRWKVPRRPRKPWHELYFTNLRTEQEDAKKRFDDLLARAGQILFKGDQLSTIEKMVTKAEHDFFFNVNYCSGVVCERNSLLNLATIHKRHKVVKWLVETKGADIESEDRGSFTPLLNAAWAGDKYLVRFLLQKGANRQHVGTCHYSGPLASPDFAGRTAAGWAQHRGHEELARLIELGL